MSAQGNTCFGGYYRANTELEVIEFFNNLEAKGQGSVSVELVDHIALKRMVQTPQGRVSGFERTWGNEGNARNYIRKE